MRKLIKSLSLIGLLTLPLVALAQENSFRFLAPLPGLAETGDPVTLAQDYIPAAIKLIIAFAAAFAVVRIIFSGIQYMSTDAFGKKSEARKGIQESLWGLLLVVASFVILGTVNPALIGDIKLSLPKFEGKGSTTFTPDGNAEELGCVDCEPVKVPHKSPPLGCAAPGPCMVNKTMNSRLLALRYKLNENKPFLDILVSEAFPPTRSHQATCQQVNKPDSGMCVDAVIPQGESAGTVKVFIETAKTVNLRAVFETTSEKRASDIRKATGLSSEQVKYIPGITGEHFSIYFPR